MKFPDLMPCEAFNNIITLHIVTYSWGSVRMIDPQLAKDVFTKHKIPLRRLFKTYAGGDADAGAENDGMASEAFVLLLLDAMDLADKKVFSKGGKPDHAEVNAAFNLAREVCSLFLRVFLSNSVAEFGPRTGLPRVSSSDGEYSKLFFQAVCDWFPFWMTLGFGWMLRRIGAQYNERDNEVKFKSVIEWCVKLQKKNLKPNYRRLRKLRSRTSSLASPRELAGLINTG